MPPKATVRQIAELANLDPTILSEEFGKPPDDDITPEEFENIFEGLQKQEIERQKEIQTIRNEDTPPIEKQINTDVDQDTAADLVERASQLKTKEQKEEPENVTPITQDDEFNTKSITKEEPTDTGGPKIDIPTPEKKEAPKPDETRNVTPTDTGAPPQQTQDSQDKTTQESEVVPITEEFDFSEAEINESEQKQQDEQEGLPPITEEFDFGRGQKSTEDKTDEFNIEEAGSNLIRGTGDVVKSIGVGTEETLGLDDIGESVKGYGEYIKNTVGEEPDEERPEFEGFNSLTNPEWWEENFSKGAGSSLPFLALGTVGSLGGGVTASAYGLGTLGQTITAGLTGTALSRPFESLAESGGVYKEARAKGKSKKEAEEAAVDQFAGTLAFGGGLDALELGLAFAPIKGSKILDDVPAGSLLREAGRIGGVASLEAFEEGGQEVIGQTSLDEEISFGPRTQEAALIGGIMGGKQGVIGSVSRAFDNTNKRFEESIDEQTEQRIELRKQNFLEQFQEEPPEGLQELGQERLEAFAEVKAKNEELKENEEARQTFQDIANQEFTKASKESVHNLVAQRFADLNNEQAYGIEGETDFDFSTREEGPEQPTLLDQAGEDNFKEAVKRIDENRPEFDDVNIETAEIVNQAEQVARQKSPQKIEDQIIFTEQLLENEQQLEGAETQENLRDLQKKRLVGELARDIQEGRVPEAQQQAEPTEIEEPQAASVVGEEAQTELPERLQEVEDVQVSEARVAQPGGNFSERGQLLEEADAPRANVIDDATQEELDNVRYFVNNTIIEPNKVNKGLEIREKDGEFQLVQRSKRSGSVLKILDESENRGELENIRIGRGEEINRRAVAEINNNRLKEEFNLTDEQIKQLEENEIESAESKLEEGLTLEEARRRGEDVTDVVDEPIDPNQVIQEEGVMSERIDEVLSGKNDYTREDIEAIERQAQEIQKQYKQTDEGAENFLSDYEQALETFISENPRNLQEESGTPFTKSVVTYLRNETTPKTFFAEKANGINPDVPDGGYPDSMKEAWDEFENLDPSEQNEQFDSLPESQQEFELTEVVEEVADDFQANGQQLDYQKAMNFIGFVRRNQPEMMEGENAQDFMKRAMKLNMIEGGSQKMTMGRDKFKMELEDLENEVAPIINGIEEALEDVDGISATEEDKQQIFETYRNQVLNNIDEFMDAKDGVKSFEDVVREIEGVEQLADGWINNFDLDKSNISAANLVLIGSNIARIQSEYQQLKQQINEREQGATTEELNRMEFLSEKILDLHKLYVGIKSRAARTLRFAREDSPVNADLAQLVNREGDHDFGKLSEFMDEQEIHDKSSIIGSLLERAERTEGVDPSSREFVEDMAKIDDMTDQIQLKNFLQEQRDVGVWRSVSEFIEWFWTNNVLSGPRTGGRNFFGALGMTVVNPVNRVGEAMFDIVKSGTETVTPQEIDPENAVREAKFSDSFQEMWAMFKALPRALGNGWRAFRHGISKNLGDSIDYWRAEPLPNWAHMTFGFPLRGMLFMDQFFRTVARAGEEQVGAIREARENQRLDASKPEDIQKALDNKTEEQMNRENEVAANTVLQGDPPPIFKELMEAEKELRSGDYFDGVPQPIQQAMSFNLRFMRTAGQMAEFSVKFLGGEFSGLVKMFKAFKKGGDPEKVEEARQMMESGRRDFGMGMAGTGFMGAVIALVPQGMITGSGPDDWKDRKKLYRSGWQPYSLYIGEGDNGEPIYMSYRYLFPMNFPLAAIANFQESKLYENTAGNMASRMIANTANFMLDQTVMYSIFRWFKLITEGSEKVRGNPIFDPLVGFIPYVGAMRTMRQSMDPTLKDPQTFMEMMKEPMPKPIQDLLAESGLGRATESMFGEGFEEDVPVVKNDFGNPIKFESPLGQFGAFVPTAMSNVNVDLETFEQNISFNRRLVEASKTTKNPSQIEQSLENIADENAKNYAIGDYIAGRLKKLDDQTEKADFIKKMVDKGLYTGDEDDPTTKWIAFSMLAEQQGIAGEKLYDADRRLMFHNKGFLVESTLDRLQGIQEPEDRMQKLQALAKFLEMAKWGQLEKEERKQKVNNYVNRVYNRSQEQGRNLFTEGS